MMVIDNTYNLGQEVFLKTDADQHTRLVTSINIRKGRITYELSYGASTSWHDDFEITEEKNIIKSTSN